MIHDIDLQNHHFGSSYAACHDQHWHLIFPIESDPDQCAIAFL